jgi:hypothetical protein
LENVEKNTIIKKVGSHQYETTDVVLLLLNSLAVLPRDGRIAANKQISN